MRTVPASRFACLALFVFWLCASLARAQDEGLPAQPEAQPVQPDDAAAVLPALIPPLAPAATPLGAFQRRFVNHPILAIPAGRYTTVNASANYVVGPGTGTDGVVALLITIPPNITHLCTGTVLPTRRHILTAAHCFMDASGTIHANAPVTVQFNLIAGELAFTGCPRAGGGLPIITDSYDVEIVVPGDFPKSPPHVRELAGRILATFHTNPDATLCLASPTRLRIVVASNPTLLAFVELLVVPYLYGHSYSLGSV